MKKILRNRLFIFILGVIITLSVNVIAATYFPSNQVTYDNKTSGLSATNVQGAIDELYKNCLLTVSTNQYFYYADATYDGDGTPQEGNLYRYNQTDNSTIKIASVSGLQYINSAATSNDSLYYSITDYERGNGTPNYGYLIKCDLNGNNCSTIASVSGLQHINSVTISNDFLYYSISDYERGGGVPNYGYLNKCDLNGNNCSTIKSVSGNTNIIF